MTPATQTLTERLLSSFPSGNYCLPALLQLAEIVETTDVPTAAVECTMRPRLLLNPEWVERHAATPEKLVEDGVKLPDLKRGRGPKKRDVDALNALIKAELAKK